MKKFVSTEDFITELGACIPTPEIVYHTYGTINPEGNNVVWICHALTANSDAADWWDGMVGPGKFYDPAQWFIVCANYIGSCYGSTGPLSLNPSTGKPWCRSFPQITVRDMVKSHRLLRDHLGIKRIHTVIGGSIGGFQALEWAVQEPSLFDHVILIACNEKSRPWAIALNESQRLAILADPTFEEDKQDGGSAGLRAARSIALLSYRNGKAYNLTQAEEHDEVTDGFRASSYQKYQGDKLVKRFDAYTYYFLSKAIDSHNVARGRGSVTEVLGGISTRVLVVGITSDILFPPEEQINMAAMIPEAVCEMIESDFGHDGFLIESASLSSVIRKFITNKK
jgi:homoserine O-acetyltransferase